MQEGGTEKDTSRDGGKRQSKKNRKNKTKRDSELNQEKGGGATERRGREREGNNEQISESHRERNTTGDLRLVTFTFSHLADAFIQSDVQKREQSSYRQ